MASQIQYENRRPPGARGAIGSKPFASCPSAVPEAPAECDEVVSRSLSELIEYQIIPRLMVAHSTDQAASAGNALSSVVFAREVEEFAPLVMQVEADAVLDQVEAMLARGVTFESVLVDLLAPAARLLGEYWEEDRFDFVEVTMGLWRLQEVVHEISVRRPAARIPGEERRALFAPVPGDQHSLGTVMVDDIFRVEGWLTDRLCDPSEADLLARVVKDWFDIIGLTVSCDCHIAQLPSLIAAIRKDSRNPASVSWSGEGSSARTLISRNASGRTARRLTHAAHRNWRQNSSAIAHGGRLPDIGLGSEHIASR